jgi:diguanylate cyclase (GGDEF)-like protein
VSGAPVQASLQLPPRSEPRLVLWFVVATALGLLLAGGGILAVVERELTTQAERHAVDRARVATSALLDRQLRAGDLASSPSPARRRQLSALFSRTSLGAHSSGATLYGKGGLIFTTNRAASLLAPHEPVQRALRGQVVSDVVSTGSGRVLRAFVPLVLSDGRGRGAIELDQDYAPIAAAARLSSLLISAVLEGLLALLCVLVVPVLARAAARLRRQVHELDWMASHDHLTRLLNRPGFGRVIDERRAGENQLGALLLFDLDRFHEVNETVGAGKGDELLVQVAARVRDAFPGRPVARLGEDEFGLLLAAASDDAVYLEAQRLLAVLADPLCVDGIQLGLAARVGVAPVAEGLGFASLLRRAGIALTAAKEDGREIALYSSADDHRDLGRLTAVGELREAIRSEQLRVHYQPQADIATGSICGVEALVRWQHPERGLLAAGEFIAAAERSGIVTQISRYVFATSVSQWQRWSRQGIRLDIAINLSAIDLLDLTLPCEIAALLAEHDMPPERLVLEITERTLLQDERQARNVLTQLNDMGIRVAIDDYGTGYSSLASLRQLPIQQVKIDRCFVTGIPGDASNDAIVGSTIDLAHALGASVVAEGIETEAELTRLAELACDLAQGYLIGRPLPAGELEQLVLRRRAEEPARTPLALALANAWQR